MSEIAVVSGRGYEESRRMVQDATSLLGGLSEIIQPESVVTIKPSLASSAPKDTGRSVPPEFILAVVEVVEEYEPKKIIVAEGSLPKPVPYNARDVFRRTGAKKLLENAGCEVVYLDEDEAVEIEIPDGMVLGRAKIPRTILDSDLVINLAKMKTHVNTLVSLGMKNMIGILYPDEKLLYHREDIHQKTVDLIKAIKPDLTIIDAITCMEGQGPAYGTPLKMNLVVAGFDPVATDSVSTAIMGISPSEVKHLRLAHSQGIGEMNLEVIEIKGLQLSKVKRHFNRPVTDVAGAFSNIDVYEGGVCSGCLAAARMALDRLKREKKIESWSKVDIIMGINPVAPNQIEGRAFIIGDCPAPRFNQMGVRIPGCPPFQAEIVESMK